MKKMTHNTFTLLLAASFLLAQTAFAQEVPAPTTDSIVPAQTVASTTPDTTTSTTATTTGQIVNLQDSSPVQDTTNTQQVATGDSLVNTVDPNTTQAVDSSFVIPVVDATTTSSDPLPVADATTTGPAPLVVASSTVDVAAVVDTPEVDPVVAIPLVQTNEALPESAPLYIQAPDVPKFDFTVTGKTLPTKKNMGGDGVEAADVTTPLTPVVDHNTGSVSVSGTCSDKYFVVLLYKNAGDYAADPGSYLINKAYPCANNTFSYAISSLPTTVANGTYYLLVGAEGDKGSWTPITSLSEITINRKQ